MTTAIILNWLDYESTIICAESVLKYTKVSRVLVVDNASPNESYEKLNNWANQSAETNRIIVIQNSDNSGYGGGNNFGINYCLTHLNSRYFWILNNDSFIEDDALTPMLNECIHNEKVIVGSVIVNSQNRLLECYGGGNAFHLLGKAKLYLKGEPIESISVRNLKVPDYIMGCSLLVSKDMVETVGLMDETYFMYSEEMDWELRAQRHGFKLAVANSSKVFHEGSGSSGGKSPTYHYYRNRGAIIFNKKFHSYLFTLTSVLFLGAIILLQEYKDKKNLLAGLKGIKDGLNMQIRKD